MASTSETGHPKNVANFENVVSFVIGYGATYNPSKTNLKVPALQTQLASCKANIASVTSTSVAFNNELLKENYPFSALINNNPNILIFPNLSAGNIAYHLMMELGNSEAIGPILLGLNKSVHVLQLGSSVRQIVNMVAIASVDAYVKRKKNKLND